MARCSFSRKSEAVWYSNASSESPDLFKAKQVFYSVYAVSYLKRLGKLFNGCESYEGYIHLTWMITAV